ncbi:MAG: 3-carboxy-cis,cis-muconate cycloisomerase [Pseudomonadota bacterium]
MTEPTSMFDHPWMSALFGDAEMAALWSAEAQLRHYLDFEAAWSRAGHLAGLWSQAEGEAAAKAIEAAQFAPADLAAGTAVDGMPIPSFVHLLKEKAGEGAIHTGSTSQDVMDTSLALSMTGSLDLIGTRLRALEVAGAALIKTHGARSLMGRTRMQAALEVTVVDRAAPWFAAIPDQLDAVGSVAKRARRVQIGGPVGDRRRMGNAPEAVVAHVAQTLGLDAVPQWHANRDHVAEFAGLLARITGSLGKMGQDLTLMAQMGEVRIRGGGGSSSMAHKQNPVQAELLVTLARFNATQVSAMHHAMVHEQERSGAAWALEWMILPQMAQACGRALNVALELCENIESVGG